MLIAESAGKTGDELQAIEDQWLAQANLQKFDAAVVAAIKQQQAADRMKAAKATADFLKRAKGKSITEMRALARDALGGVEVFFDWDAPRTREGYYRLQGGCDCAINRAVAYAPYCDAIWMESKLPDFAQAEEFAKGVHAVWPEQK